MASWRPRGVDTPTGSPRGTGTGSPTGSPRRTGTDATTKRSAAVQTINHRTGARHQRLKRKRGSGIDAANTVIRYSSFAIHP